MKRARIAAPYFAALTGLRPATTYYYCAIASNQGGAGKGQVLSFTTPAAPPTVTTQPATVTGVMETLSGIANPNGTAGTAWFRYDTTSPGTCNDGFGTRVPADDGVPLGSGMDDVGFSRPANDLSPGTYYFCAIAGMRGERLSVRF